MSGEGHVNPFPARGNGGQGRKLRLRGKSDKKGRADVFGGFHPDLAAVALDHATDQRQVHAFANLEKWNSLPKHYQAIVHQASHVANTTMCAKYDAGNPAALKRLIAGGAQLRAFPPAVMDASFKAANEIYAELATSNPDFKKVYEAVVPFRNDQYLWWQVAEYGFDTFMIRARTRS